MLQCPYCGCPSLSKNGSTRGVPKWQCKSCGRQTSLRGRRAGTDHDNAPKQIEAALLYLSGLSLNAIAFWKSVVPSTVLNWVRQFARQPAAKPKPESFQAASEITSFNDPLIRNRAKRARVRLTISTDFDTTTVRRRNRASQ